MGSELPPADQLELPTPLSEADTAKTKRRPKAPFEVHDRRRRGKFQRSN